MTKEIDDLRSEIQRLLKWVQAKMSQEQVKVDPIIQQVGMFNLRISDMMTQLNTVLKAMLEENAALRKERISEG